MKFVAGAPTATSFTGEPARPRASTGISVGLSSLRLGSRRSSSEGERGPSARAPPGLVRPLPDFVVSQRAATSLTRRTIRSNSRAYTALARASRAAAASAAVWSSFTLGGAAAARPPARADRPRRERALEIAHPQELRRFAQRRGVGDGAALLPFGARRRRERDVDEVEDAGEDLEDRLLLLGVEPEVGERGEHPLVPHARLRRRVGRRRPRRRRGERVRLCIAQLPRRPLRKAARAAEQIVKMWKVASVGGGAAARDFEEERPAAARTRGRRRARRRA